MFYCSDTVQENLDADITSAETSVINISKETFSWILVFIYSNIWLKFSELVGTNSELCCNGHLKLNVVYAQI